ncbi:MAG: gluconate 2-dehydrogenase subunit 3 family protein, partial [Gemmatimonadota bacterium]|nr:gluconate 2-dehydrogenase subunit 3 family protein [Gemmatimonadota bacterium]
MKDDGWTQVPFDRRTFVRRVGGAAGGALLSVHLAACRDLADQAREAAAAGSGFSTLTADEGRQLEAVCATLIPSGDTPGAREAGAAHFIDLVLGTFEAGNLPTIREGLSGLKRRVESAEGSGTSFADLSAARQVEILADVEREDPV